MKKILLLLALFLSNYCFAQKTYLQCGHLIDVNAGKTLSEMTVVIEGTKIIEVINGYQNGGKADKIINLKDKTVLPGLIDCHVHLEFQTSKDAFREGFTSSEADVAFRSAEYAKTTLMAGFP